jgi:hypothetical protein
MHLVHVDIDPACTDPKQALDDGEFVDVLSFPYNDLLRHITDYSKVCSKLQVSINGNHGSLWAFKIVATEYSYANYCYYSK